MSFAHLKPVAEPRSELYCSYCQYLARRSRQTNCGHLFCEECVLNLHKCTKCGEKITTLYPDKAIDSEIASIAVYCTEKERGCKWVGKLSQLFNHQEQCSLATMSSWSEGGLCCIQTSHQIHMERRRYNVEYNTSSEMGKLEASQTAASADRFRKSADSELSNDRVRCDKLPIGCLEIVSTIRVSYDLQPYEP